MWVKDEDLRVGDGSADGDFMGRRGFAIECDGRRIDRSFGRAISIHPAATGMDFGQPAAQVSLLRLFSSNDHESKGSVGMVAFEPKFLCPLMPKRGGQIGDANTISFKESHKSLVWR